ncbi:MAG: hypothetical protein HY075_12975 [Deltaproteobacteria bacterium]|nr:hypothetical protein [Deltaproteobacteria bacterium]
MKHRFRVVEEQDCTVAVAIGAYLDCEHYVHLHRSIMTKLSIDKVEGRKVTWRQGLRWLGFLKITQTFVMEYFPPGHFKSYDMKAYPRWLPQFHHFVKTVMDVRYTKHPQRDATVMTFDCEMDMPFFLWPFRNVFQGIVEKMHHLKDQEDLDMIHRRDKFFGRGNINSYLAEGQFLLFKDDYVAHFAHEAQRAQPATAAELNA